MANPLVSDRNVEFILYELLRVEELCKLPRFADQGRGTCDLVLASAGKLAREQMFPAFKPMDAEPPRLVDGQVHIHPAMRELWPKMLELGLLGQHELPLAVAVMASHYCMAA